jgi:hypothetical protein
MKFLLNNKSISVRLTACLALAGGLIMFSFAGLSHYLYYQNTYATGIEKLEAAQRYYFTQFSSSVNKGKENLISTLKNYSQRELLTVHVELGTREKSRAFQVGEPVASNLDFLKKALSNLQDNRYVLYSERGLFFQEYQLDSYGEKIYIVAVSSVLQPRQKRIILSFYVLAVIALIALLLVGFQLALGIETPVKRLLMALELDEVRDIIPYTPYKEIADLSERISESISKLHRERFYEEHARLSSEENHPVEEKQVEEPYEETDNLIMAEESIIKDESIVTPSKSSSTDFFNDDPDNVQGNDMQAIMEGLFERPFTRLKNVESALFPADIEANSADFYVAQQYENFTRQFLLNLSENSASAILLKHRIQERFLALAEFELPFEKIVESILKVLHKSGEENISWFLSEHDMNKPMLKYCKSGSFSGFRCAETSSEILEQESDLINMSFGEIALAANDKITVFSKSILEALSMNDEKACNDLIVPLRNDATARGYLSSLLSRIQGLGLDNMPSGLINVLSRK